tara:strand:+ start:880 stop:4680 length:3801 start_codon:yes stop_codon:yes gene_type:complete
MSIFVDFVGLNTIISSSFVTGTFDNVLSSGYNPNLGALKPPELPSINIHRNGPYRFATFKQIRIHENPLTRYQKKNNLLSFSKRPIQKEITDANNRLLLIQEKFGDLVTFTEPAVVSTYHPLVYNLGTLQGENTPSFNRFGLSFDYSNHITYFTNKDLNELLLLDDLDDEVYEQIKELYLNGALNSNASEIDYFEFLRYKQEIYPREINRYSANVRKRPNYQNNFWRDIRTDRNRRVVDIGGDGFFFAGTNAGDSYPSFNALQHSSQSMWHLDPQSNWATRNNAALKQLGIAENSSVSNQADTGRASDTGILLNKYCHFVPFYSHTAIDQSFRSAAPLYSRLHTVPHASSVNGHTSGLPIPETGSGIGEIFQGHALWQAGEQAGKNPFYSSYDFFIEELRGIGKDFTIVPEFKISQHVEALAKDGNTQTLESMLDLSGALSSANVSTESSFYETYSTTDFLKHFASIKKDHENFEDPAAITLTCKALKKFLAYDSFYPVQRSVDCTKQFMSSYSKYIDVFAATGVPRKIGFQAIMDPLFAPGVLYNAIKSGMAVDYPIMTSGSSVFNGSAAGSNGETFHFIKAPRFDKRVPFEALIQPEKHLSGIGLRGNVVHPSGSYATGSLFWDGKGDPFYKKMISNYLAEVPSFFLQGGNFTTISSLPQGNDNFGVAELGRTYAMRIKMYKTKDDNNLFFQKAEGVGDYAVPQDNNGTETITMYSRPSAFGPPVAQSTPTTRSSKGGFNPCFTPPYYDGESWIDFIWKAPEAGQAAAAAGVTTKKFSISEIISTLTASAIRFDVTYESASYGGINNGPLASDNQFGAIAEKYRDPFYASEISRLNYLADVAQPINVNSVKLPASINPLLIGKINTINNANDTILQSANLFQSANENSNEARWLIQTKFETPILNFKDVELTVSASGGTGTIQRNGQTPRGMWHQYGVTPENEDGIFLQVTDVPFEWLKNKVGDTSTYNQTGSLADLCGFSNEPVKLGKVSEKTISEAVVAVPYIDDGGVKKFFEINQNNFINAKQFFQATDIINSGGNPETLGLGNPEFFEQRAGRTIIDQVKKMKRYVFPPSMDFINYSNVTPFSMYIFEFTHTLTQKDLTDIWQGVPPEIGTSFEIAEDSISHPLLANELLGSGEGDDRSRIGSELSGEIRWMVFKVKKRANTNYFSKIAGSPVATGQAARGAGILTDATNVETQQDLISYNWPYDFFSLVELVKIDAEIEFSEISQEDESGAPGPKFTPKRREIPEAVQEFAANLSRRRR